MENKVSSVSSSLLKGFHLSCRNIFFNPIMTHVAHRVETSRLICIANQLTGFYMMRKIGR